MKLSFVFTLLFAQFGVITLHAEDILPPRFNFDRYSAMVEHSPFAIATAVALPSATADFAKDLYVANAGHTPEGDMVTIASTSDQNFKKYLTTKEPVDGYSIASIEWSDRVGATKVTISKDGKFATLTFNEALLSQQGPNTPPGMPGNMPPNVPSFPNARAEMMQREQAMPAIPSVPSPVLPPPNPRQTPRPHVRGIIPRSPKAAVTPNPGVQQQQLNKSSPQ